MHLFDAHDRSMNESEPIEAAVRRVETDTPGWRCVWLPRHQHFLAYMDVGMPNGERPPAVVAQTVTGLLGEIGTHAELRRLVREYLKLQGAA